MSHIFGPVPSRRLGLSLGVDLIPHKTCTFDCLYCEVGRTTNRTITSSPFTPVDEILSQLDNRLATCSPDVITLAGSGEPTLHSEIHHIISGIRKLTDTRIVILTNGSLFWDDAVRERVLGADLIMPTLSSAVSSTFQTIHRPHPDLTLDCIVDGLKQLRSEFNGLIYLEVILLAGINDTEEEMRALKPLIRQIQPEKIQLNTVVRPPADVCAKALDSRRLEEIKLFLGERAEIVVDIGAAQSAMARDTKGKGLLEMVRRRPLRLKDIAHSMGLSMDEVESLVKGLLLKGYLRRQDHSGEIFYMGNEVGRS
ncbi:MAG: radical SAM protein [Deltaproteobacteria bacterium]|nr:radical SAM protein [Deltaproteobacteria bacterium]